MSVTIRQLADRDAEKGKGMSERLRDLANMVKKALDDLEKHGLNLGRAGIHLVLTLPQAMDLQCLLQGGNLRPVMITVTCDLCGDQELLPLSPEGIIVITREWEHVRISGGRDRSFCDQCWPKLTERMLVKERARAEETRCLKSP